MGDLGSISGSGRYPGEGNGNPLPVFVPGEFHGQRSMVGYSPWGQSQTQLSDFHVTLNRALPSSACLFSAYGLPPLI